MAFGTGTKSAKLDTGGDFEFFTDGTDAVAVQLNPGERLGVIFSAENPGTTDNFEYRVLAGYKAKTGDTLDAGGTTTLDLDTAADPIDADDELNGEYIVITSGTQQGVGRLITASANANDRVTLDHSMTDPGTASYERYRLGIAFQGQIDLTGSAGEDTPDHRTSPPIEVQGPWEWVLFQGRATGTPTDAIDAWVSYQKDGISV